MSSQDLAERAIGTQDCRKDTFQWHRGKRAFVILSLAFLAFLLYAVAHVH